MNANKQTNEQAKKKNRCVFTLLKWEFVPVIFQVQCERNANACLSRSRLFAEYLRFEWGVLFALYRATR